MAGGAGGNGGFDFSDIPSFCEVAEECVASAASNYRYAETRSNRVVRRFSLREVCDILGVERGFLNARLEHPDAPQGEIRGREKTLSVDDIMKLRALSETGRKGRRPRIFWRRPGDKLPVITVCSQKGGVARTCTAAHLAQYLTLYYGLRVGVIDADPQATCSLYFVDSEVAISGYDVETFTDFMGVPEPGVRVKIEHSPERLNTFWQRTPWPGLRLLPGGAAIQEADISLHHLLQSRDPHQKAVNRYLRDALRSWDAANPPRTGPEDLFDCDGNFRDDVYQKALYEAVDVVIIDTAPALSLAQLNAVVAADTIILPQSMKGFDLWTLRVYLASLNDYFRHIRSIPEARIDFAEGYPFILPTIVSRHNDSDMRTIGELYAANPHIISPVFYRYSEGAANAFREYKSAYEYQPDRNRRRSIESFIANANAVGDAIAARALPGLPSRGFANAFIRESYPEDTLPMWSEDELAVLGSEVREVA